MATTRASLLERVRDRGDAVAWEEFFSLYAPLLESYARSFGLSGADAEDVRDQCMATLVQRVEGFRYDRSKGSFQGWLHRMARGRVLDGMRRVREQRPDTAELAAIPDPGEQPDEAWDRAWRSEHVRFALAEVRRSAAPEARERIDLLLDEDLTAAEISSRTGLNENQVYKARSRLLQDVRDVLRRLGEDG